jgi:hypothetical protein
LIAFIAKHASILIPELHCCFEDDEVVYLVMDYIKGVSMNELKEEKQKVVEKELKVYIDMVKKLKSKFWVGLWGLYVACINEKISLNSW